MSKGKSLSWDAFQQMGNPENAPEMPKENKKGPNPVYAKMAVRIHLKKMKGNKEATIIKGIKLDPDTLKKIGKELKIACGVGGNVKQGEIMLQGNHRDKVLPMLIDRGFKDTKKSGG